MSFYGGERKIINRLFSEGECAVSGWGEVKTKGSDFLLLPVELCVLRHGIPFSLGI